MSVIEKAGFLEFKLRKLTTPPARRLFVTPEIMNLFDGVDNQPEMSPTRCSAMAERFVAGHVMFVSRQMGDKRPNLERLERVDEIWALCVREPKPGWRFFGRFMHQDVLVLQAAHSRTFLGALWHYEQKAKEIIPAWEKAFPLLPPVSGDKIEDYLSGEMWRDLDAPE
ncbi:MAG: hypothetical protein EOO15_16790 [Chitinophagaceae bacterium]|nr:MAG: hypothetical protein EOO15_16790 [Chitinophagaceae bacterium]